VSTVAAPVPAAVGDAVDPALLARLAGVPGLDATRGMAVVRGKAARYVDLLRQFVAYHADDMTPLAEFLAVGDQATAVRLAHSLKGAAGTVGADGIAAGARRIELALRESPAAAGEQLHADMADIERAFQSLTTVLAVPPLPAPPPAEAPAPKLLRQILAALESRLDEGDFTAVALFRDHADVLRTALGSRYDEVAAQIRQFDFKAALATLRGRSAL
jgi:HPt (histidine-containing phosphotransfer) domain-containing protein